MILFDEQMEIILPPVYKCLDSTSLRERYSGRQKPQIVLEGGDEEVFAFFHTHKQAYSTQLKNILKDSTFLIGQIYPDTRFLDKGTISLKYGIMEWVEFKRSIEKELYYKLFLTIINGNLLVGTFQCQWKKHKKFKETVTEILSTVVDRKNLAR